MRSTIFSARSSAFKRGERRAARRDRAKAFRRRGDRGEGGAHLRCARRAEADARPAGAEGPAAGARWRFDGLGTGARGERAQGGVRAYVQDRRDRRAEAARGEGGVDRHDARQRLPGAAGDGSGDRPAARDRLADPRHRRHPHRVVQRLSQAVRDDRLRDRLGRRDRRARRRPIRRRWSSSNIR